MAKKDLKRDMASLKVIPGKKKPFKISKLFAEHSPMKNVQNVRMYLEKYKKNPANIGFTNTASLKSMGLIPRSNGLYQLGKKYELLRQ